jgi:ABC-2 type transport system permease protein
VKGAAAVFRREFEAQFASPGAWTVAAGFLLWNALGWTALVEAHVRAARHAVAEGLEARPFAEAGLDSAVLGLAFALVLFVPFVSMRLLADERRLGSDEILFTLPLTATQVVLGKVAAAATVVLALVVPVLIPPLLLPAEAAVDPGRVLAVGLGLFLLGLALLAIGTWASSLTDQPIAAAALALTLGLVLFFVDRPLDGRLADLSIRLAFERFAGGVVGLRDGVHLLAVGAFFVFLAVQTVELRREAE